MPFHEDHLYTYLPSGEIHSALPLSRQAVKTATFPPTLPPIHRLSAHQRSNLSLPKLDVGEAGA